MLNKSPLLIILLTMSLSLTIPSSLIGKPLEFGVLGFPPFYIIKSSTKIEGTKAELMRTVLKHAGIKFTEKGYPPKRLYNNIAEGKTNLWMGIKGVSVYDDKVLYSKEATDTIEIRVYTRSEKEPPKTMAALKGKKIITIRGYSYGGMIRYLKDPNNAITVDPSDTHQLAFIKLTKNRADYLLDYKSPAEVTINKYGFSNLKYSSLKKLDLFFIVSKKTPNADKILEKMENAYADLKRQGKIKE